MKNVKKKPIFGETKVVTISAAYLCAGGVEIAQTEALHACVVYSKSISHFMVY